MPSMTLNHCQGLGHEMSNVLKLYDLITHKGAQAFNALFGTNKSIDVMDS
jgi:hypothetical protein